MSDKPQTKVAVSMAEMSRMVGLSRARFYQLVEAGVFPRPGRQVETGRPFYSEEQQLVILEVRRRNCGVNGQPVLFYARRLPTSASPSRSNKGKARPEPKEDPHAWLVEALKECKLESVTPAQVAAVDQLYPSGTAGVNEGEVFRAVFNHLKDATGPGR